MLFQKKKSGFDSALDLQPISLQKNKNLEILQNNRSHKRIEIETRILMKNNA